MNVVDETILWHLTPAAVSQLERSQALGMRERFARTYNFEVRPEVELGSGVAQVRVDGVISRRPHLLQAWYSGVSSEGLAETIRELEANEDVHTVVFRIDSPGGEAHGMPELAAAVARLGKVKRTIAQIEGHCYSAGYYLASQCGEVYAGESDEVGSIGTLLSLVDWSKAYEQAGIERVAITNQHAKFKSLGLPGLPVTEEQRNYLQGLVDETQEGFTLAVMEGRDLSREQVEALADGRFFSAREAVDLGLIDGVQSIDHTLSQLKGARMSTTTKRQEGEAITATLEQTSPTRPEPATFAELSQRLPKAGSDFVVEALQEQWTLDQAVSKYTERQEAELEKLRSQVAEQDKAKQEAANKASNTAQIGGTGVDATLIDTAGQGSGQHATDAHAAWKEKVDECTKECNGDRRKGFLQAAKLYPDLQAAAKSTPLLLS